MTSDFKSILLLTWAVISLVTLPASSATAAQLDPSISNSFIPMGTGVSHIYENIPFEVFGVHLLVYHKGAIDFKHTDTYDLSSYIADKIHIIQFSEYADCVPDNVTVGHIIVYYTDGTSVSIDIICGVNTAEWSYDRPEEQLYLQHTKIPPAFSMWTDIDSACFYWAHAFYVAVDTDINKELSYLELVLDPASYTGQTYYGYALPDWYGIHIEAITLEVPKIVPAIIDIDPNTLNLKSRGRWITCYIELPMGYDPMYIDVSTIRLKGVVAAEQRPTEIGDYDGDGIPDLTVKFDRAAVQTLLKPGEVKLTVTGSVNGLIFRGSDTIRVIDD